MFSVCVVDVLAYYVSTTFMVVLMGQYALFNQPLPPASFPRMSDLLGCGNALSLVLKIVEIFTEKNCSKCDIHETAEK